MTHRLTRLIPSLVLVTLALACSGPEAQPSTEPTAPEGQERIETPSEEGNVTAASNISFCGIVPGCPEGYAPVRALCTAECYVRGYSCDWGHNYVECTPVQASGSISANPTTVSINLNQTSTGTTEICWDVDNVSTGEVWVSMNGAPESLFASGSSGCQYASWIQAGSTYSFNLYAGSSHSNLLGSAGVTGSGYYGPPPEEPICNPATCPSGSDCRCGDVCWPRNRECP
ncbi:hypothetical protein [Pyxidicoccus xibeiensis]|uniref:hypothetical protein n=1 Tax=Pyxidicoccus xibeiensis TaxID=2906759 RepID=UPI0020A7058A|nr:hypothetical protein [Pyxidicoccus xibeiensis]MCP3139741.1 hypothetical protein [Pyxidicoccus xibeiensis]